jgi:CRISPR-associated protein Csm3
MLTNMPYIPGSSLKGKLRSLAEKRGPNTPQNQPMGEGIRIHACGSQDCKVCLLYGVPASDKPSSPTRLMVKDVFLDDKKNERLFMAETDQPFTEVKYEVAIDRVTAKANPRPVERVPAGSTFGPMEMTLNIYRFSDLDLFQELLEVMRLLEDDYLGGGGSRGSGRIEFRELSVTIKPIDSYSQPQATLYSTDPTTLKGLIEQEEVLVKKMKELIRIPARSKPSNG